MKRYWKTLVIVLAVLLSIGSFYIRNAVSASSLPQFTFAKESGDEREITPIVLEGSFDRSGHFGSAESFHISNNKIQYSSEQSFIEQITNEYGYGIRDLQEKYSSFMRGKRGPASFYEDKDFLAYAAIKEEGSSEKKDYSLNISLLDKEKEDWTQFAIEIPLKKSISFMNEVDVQLIGGTLKVVTDQEFHTNSDFQQKEVHVYSIDLSSKKIMADDLIFKSEKVDSGFIDYEKLTETNIRNSNQYVVYEKSYLEEGTDSQEDKTLDKSRSELIVYNLETGKQKMIQTIVNDPDYTGYQSFYDDSSIYIVNRKDDRLEIETNNIKNKQLTNTFEFPILSSENGEDTKLIIKKDRIYLYSADESYPRQTQQPQGLLIVADLMTGKKLYKGELKAKKGTEMKGILRINNMEIK